MVVIFDQFDWLAVPQERMDVNMQKLSKHRSRQSSRFCKVKQSELEGKLKGLSVEEKVTINKFSGEANRLLLKSQERNRSLTSATGSRSISHKEVDSPTGNTLSASHRRLASSDRNLEAGNTGDDRPLRSTSSTRISSSCSHREARNTRRIDGRSSEEDGESDTRSLRVKSATKIRRNSSASTVTNDAISYASRDETRRLVSSSIHLPDINGVSSNRRKSSNCEIENRDKNSIRNSKLLDIKYVPERRRSFQSFDIGDRIDGALSPDSEYDSTTSCNSSASSCRSSRSTERPRSLSLAEQFENVSSCRYLRRTSKQNRNEDKELSPREIFDSESSPSVIITDH